MSLNGLLPTAFVLFLGLITVQHAQAENRNLFQHSFLFGSTSNRQSCRGRKERCRRFGSRQCCAGLECRTRRPQRNRCFDEGSTCDLTYNTNQACSCYDYWGFSTREPQSVSELTSNTGSCLFSPPTVSSTSVQVGVTLCLTTCKDDAERNMRVLEGILEVTGEAESGANFTNCISTNIKKIYPYSDGNVPDCRDVANIYKNVEPITKLILSPSNATLAALQACGVKTTDGNPAFKAQLSNINGFFPDRLALCPDGVSR